MASRQAQCAFPVIWGISADPRRAMLAKPYRSNRQHSWSCPYCPSNTARPVHTAPLNLLVSSLARATCRGLPTTIRYRTCRRLILAAK